MVKIFNKKQENKKFHGYRKFYKYVSGIFWDISATDMRERRKQRTKDIRLIHEKACEK